MKLFRALLTWIFVLTGAIILSAQNNISQPLPLPDSSFLSQKPFPAHAFHLPYASPEAAYKNLPRRCKNYLSLQGDWLFFMAEKRDELPVGFQAPDFVPTDWDTITIPFNRETLLFQRHRTEDIIALYKQNFEIPQNWLPKKIILRFENLGGKAFIWLNGKAAGYNHSALRPVEFDVTPFVQEGDNSLCIELRNTISPGGIAGPVSLYALPTVYVNDYFIRTQMEGDSADATVFVELDLRNDGAEQARWDIEIKLFDRDGYALPETPSYRTSFELDAFSAREIKLKIPVKNPPRWSAEDPQLVTFLLALTDENNRHHEAFSCKFGFRELLIQEQQFTVNGRPVKLNAVDYPMHHPQYGPAVPAASLQTDLSLMKQFNINSLRTGTHPPSPELLKLADELGLYVIETINSKDSSLILRDRNHPCLIGWATSGEANSLSTVLVHKLDPSRPIRLSDTPDQRREETVLNFHSPVPFRVGEAARGKIFKNDQRAIFLTDYLKPTGNALGSVADYWNIIRKYPRVIGGTINAWTNRAIETPLHFIPDNSAHKNNGLIFGHPIFTEGAIGWGLQLKNPDDKVEFYRNPSLDFQLNQFTINFWLKTDSCSGRTVLISNGEGGLGIQLNNNMIEFFANGDQRYVARAPLDSSFFKYWQQIHAFCDGRQLQLFINHKRFAHAPFSGQLKNTGLPLCIGNPSAPTTTEQASPFIIDELIIFDRALPSKEIKNNNYQAILHLDFETDSIAGKFYYTENPKQNGFLVLPDRQVLPALYALKQAAQPVNFEMVKAEEGIIRIHNLHHVKNLNRLQGVWQILVDGEATQRGFFDCDLPAGETKDVKIDYRRPRINSDAECLLDISFVLKEDEAWAPRGHKLAGAQFPIPTDYLFVEKQPEKAKLIARENAQQLQIVGPNFRYTFSKTTGELTSLLFNGTEYLSKGLALQVWRAPLTGDLTDDTAGTSRLTDHASCTTIQLLEKGLHRLSSELVEISAREQEEGSICVKIDAVSYAHQPLSEDYQESPSAFERREEWLITPDGTIQFSQTIIPHGPMPEMLPRIGLRWELPQSFYQVEYYGRGPHENYPDRRVGSQAGYYSNTTDSIFVAYPHPQDYGNRCDVRFLKVLDEQGKGIEIRGEHPFHFSLQPYDSETLTRARYTFQLQKANNNFLNIDYEVSGIGDSLRKPLQPYRVRPSLRTYRLVIKPF